MDMTESQAKDRIRKLSEEINFHNDLYYLFDSPSISDYDFDLLLKELIDLETIYPQFAFADSPSQRVGGTITKQFKDVKHKSPMLSLSNTYSEGDLREFDHRIREAVHEHVEYVCELKYDGVAISLIYEDGILQQAITRGDGMSGDDVTNNVKTIKTIPLRLKKVENLPDSFEIRGEIIMPHQKFNQLNQ
jgi:DNA ligase (NAD+)